ncbi:MAG: NAD(P)-binding domain-containing protein [Steroidobacteraceae bacterium]|nr:NAD(P)-binding domain-containing protein [Nevskiaceae bacterium]
MRVGILGSGQVAQSLANGFLALGHEVMLGSREPGNPASAKWAQAAGAKVSGGTFAQAAAFGDLLVLATLGTATPHAIEMAGLRHFDEKLVLDVTNPLDFSHGKPPALVGAPGSSAGETHQRLLPKARIVKTFNTVGNALFFRPKLQGGVRGDMFLCGDDAGAKERTADLIRAFGWEPIDIGGIDASHYLEATCMVWILNAMRNNDWNRAFKLVPAA